MFHGRYWVTDLLAVLDAEGVERAALVGHSIGGWTALRMAIDHPERVSRLVLIASSGGLLTPRVLEGLTGGAMSVTREEDPWRRMLAPDFGEREPVLAHLHRQIQGLNPPLDPASVAQTVDVQVRPEELTGFAVPTLLVVGRCDAVFAPGVLEEATSPIAGVKTVALDGVGNSAHFEAPEAFNRLCADFIDARS
jgi:3-oxoadipate enol-lactonase